MATALAADSNSDYGYDLSLEEEGQLLALLDQVSPEESQPASTSLRRVPRSDLTHDINVALSANIDLQTESYLDRDSRFDLAELEPAFAYIRNVSRDQPGAPHSPAPTSLVPRGGSLQQSASHLSRTSTQTIPLASPERDVSYPDLSKPLSAFDADDVSDVASPGPEPELQSTTRSPLVRFRTFPKKPFSVSDLTAGAWCELQYWYTLTLLPGGKKTRTAAMRAGSRIHKQLEDAVHATVQIDVATQEDAFGLKIWNVIQGLRTLRETGLTRELEVWGIIEDQVVNGIIDGLSYENPDAAFEEEYLSSQGSQAVDSGKESDKGQPKITGYFPSSPADEQPAPSATPSGPKIYLTDVKTRASSRLPSGAALRPTKVQLFLYHSLLSEMAFKRLDYMRIFRRYGLNPDRQFSDTFMAQVGDLHDEIFYDAQSNPASPASSASSFSELMRYHSLRALVPLLEDELVNSFPAGGDSLGTLVTVEYRSRARPGIRTRGLHSGAKTGDQVPVPENGNGNENGLGGEEGEGEDNGDEDRGGRLIGSVVFPVDHGLLRQYIARNMEWWRGEREAAGVPIEEAYKCRSCEFADGCGWRREQDGELLRLAQERMAARAAAENDGDQSPRRRGRPPKEG